MSSWHCLLFTVGNFQYEEDSNEALSPDQLSNLASSPPMFPLSSTTPMSIQSPTSFTVCKILLFSCWFGPYQTAPCDLKYFHFKRPFRDVVLWQLPCCAICVEIVTTTNDQNRFLV